ncbi:MAG TPA: tetratricopeptide repeat protein [Candidatus Acidoferrales bacterium]|nr:tetratricopeptide repeat protein [Candidatus Acidoferrales bacterium]
MEEFSFKKFFYPLTSVKAVHFIILTGLIVYFKSLFNGFVWDDADQIVNNPLILHLGNIPYFFTHSTFYTGGAQSALSGLYYRPTMMVLFALTASMWGVSSFMFHLNTIVLHIANSILIYFFIKKLLGVNKLKYAIPASFSAAMLYLVHPANVEAVAYVSATSELLYTFFLLVALNATLSFGFSSKYSFAKLLLIFISVTLSLFSKESALLTVLFVLFLSFFFFRGKIKILLIPSLLGVGLYSFFRFILSHLSAPQNNIGLPIAKAPLTQRLFTVPYELFSYIRIILFPKDLHISQAYIVTNPSSVQFYLPFFADFIMLFIGLYYLIRAKSRLLYFFTLWLCLSLGLVLNIIVPLDFTIEERWLYVPLIGVFGIAAVIFSNIFGSKWKFLKQISVVVVIIAIILFSLRTMIRIGDWVDSLTLYRHDIVLSHDSFELYTNYGSTLYSVGELAQSEDAYRKAIQLEPNDLWALNDLGSIYANQGDYKKAMPLYQKSMQIAPTYASYENLAEIYYLTEKPFQVIPVLKQYLQVFPNSAKLNQLTALEYSAVGEIDLAKAYARKSAALNSTSDNVTPLLPLLQ